MVGSKWLGLSLGTVISLSVALDLFGADEDKGPELVATGLLENVGQAEAGSSAGTEVSSGTELVKVAVDGKEVSMPVSVRDSFNFLKELQVVLKESEDKPDEIVNITSSQYIDYERLKLLVNLMTGVTKEVDYDFKTLIEQVCLAIFLIINDWELLRPVLTRIKELATPALVAQMAAELPEIRVPLDVIVHVTKFADAREVQWQPDGQGYAVKFSDNSWQRYDLEGEAQGPWLVGVARVLWHPDGQGYWVNFIDSRWQRYDLAGVEQGPALVGVVEIKWQPDGQGYGVLFWDDVWQRYDLAGEAQGLELVGVSRVEWQPDGQGYGVRFLNGSWQRYNLAGEAQGQVFVNVDYVQWQPDGQGYGVRFNDGRWQRYDLAGMAQGQALKGVDSVKWRPDGQGYGVLFLDGRWQRYNLAGVAQGPVFVNVYDMQWQPDRQWYGVKFRSGSLEICASLPQVEQETFGAQLAVQAVLNEYSITKTPVELSLTLERLLGDDLSSILQQYGYVKLIPSDFRILGIDTAAMLLPLKQGGAGAGSGK